MRREKGLQSFQTPQTLWNLGYKTVITVWDTSLWRNNIVLFLVGKQNYLGLILKFEFFDILFFFYQVLPPHFVAFYFKSQTIFSPFPTFVKSFLSQFPLTLFFFFSLSHKFWPCFCWQPHCLLKQYVYTLNEMDWLTSKAMQHLKCPDMAALRLGGWRSPSKDPPL